MARALWNARPRFWAVARFALALAVLLTGASMLLYPGGTALDASTRGYSFAHNFLSDLGSTVGLNGERNVAGAGFMGLAIVIGVLMLGGSFVVTVRVLSRVPRARIFANLAAAAGALVCAGFLGVALAPIDRAWSLHKMAGLVAFHSFPAATALLAVATARDGRFRAQAAAGWVALTLVLAACIAIAYVGPDMATEHGLVTHVIAQKVMTASILAALWFESYEAEHAETRV